MVLPNSFIKRRLHSLTGLFLSLFLIEHLLVNSQSALFLGDHGAGFVRSVNGIHDLPYLGVIEVLLLLIPFVYHGYLGIIYLFEAAPNNLSVAEDGPALPEYSRNWRYTLQRVTAFILVFGVIAHVVHMRFLDYPKQVEQGAKITYEAVVPAVPAMTDLITKLEVPYQVEGDSIRVTNVDFGTAELFIVRKSFLTALPMILYVLFVLSAVFHGFNGLWTFLITWGITLSERSQRLSWYFSSFLMALLSLLGMFAIFGG